MERRKRDRRSLQLVCYVHSAAISAHQLVGVSKNISRTGILMALREDVSLAESIEVGLNATVEVQLPAEHSLGPRCMRGEGQIVRVTNGDREIQIAMRFRNLEFRDLASGGSVFVNTPMTSYVM